MSWIATLVQSEVVAGQVQVGIVYSDGTQKLFRSYQRATLDDNGLAQIADAEIQGLTASVGKQVITLALGSTIPKPTPVTPVTPTPDELARAAFTTAYRVLQGRLALVSAGIIALDDKSVAEARANALALFKAEYLP